MNATATYLALGVIPQVVPAPVPPTPPSFPVTLKPTFPGFQGWVYRVMGVPVEWLPTDSDAFFYAYNTAVATVNDWFECIPGPILANATYNLAGHLLITWAPDITTTPPYPYKVVDGVPYGYFEWIRKQNNVLGFTTGTVSSSSDEGTSVALVVPEQAKNMTLDQLQLMSTPYGRSYLGIAQKIGTQWGIS